MPSFGLVQVEGQYRSDAPWGWRINSVTIENGITEIGVYAFFGCTNLTSVMIPGSVTKIEYMAFADCTNLTSVVIPEGVTGMGDYAFKGCCRLTGVTIPSSLCYIGSFSFKDCGDLTSIVIPEGVKYIKDSAFIGCDNLESVVIPSSMIRIGADAFKECRLREVHITSLASWVAVIPGNRYSNPMFANAAELYLNGEVLTEAVIPEGVASISGYALANCRSLTSVTIPSSVTRMGRSAFAGCSALMSVEIAEGMESVGESAFADCVNLMSVTIPSSVTSIGKDAFKDCTALREVHIPSVEAWVAIVNGNYRSNPLFGSKAVLYMHGEAVTDVIIPEGVMSIGDRAFEGYAAMTSVTIPSSVTSIGVSAFDGCSGLTSVVIPESVTSIDMFAFADCTNVTSVTITSALTFLHTLAFSEHNRIENIIITGEQAPTFTLPSQLAKGTVWCAEWSEVDFWALEHGYKTAYLNPEEADRPLEFSISLANDSMLVGDVADVAVNVVFGLQELPITWSSSAPEVVEVMAGRITAIRPGEATITAACGDVSDSVTVTVEAPVKQFTLSVSELAAISKATVEIDICGEQPSEQDSFTVVSSDPGVARPTLDGRTITVLCLRPGTAVLTVMETWSGCTQECTIWVSLP